MYEENNQYQNYNSMPYDNTAANRAEMAYAENTAAPQGTAGNSGNNNSGQGRNQMQFGYISLLQRIFPLHQHGTKHSGYAHHK